MKKFAVALVAVLAVVLFTSCGSIEPRGAIFIDGTFPVAVGTGAPATKVGESSCHQLLGWIVTGDASIKAACENGGITKIAYVDWKVKNIAGIIADYTLTVYGE